jgi:peptidoglycan/xylan/chitin deacetylase (PgdA/CDA1 family)
VGYGDSELKRLEDEKARETWTLQQTVNKMQKMQATALAAGSARGRQMLYAETLKQRRAQHQGSQQALHELPRPLAAPATPPPPVKWKAAAAGALDLKAVVAAGHELAIHSWIHEFNSRLSESVERDLALRAADVLERIGGVRPVGMRTASWDFSPWTLKIIREMGLIYDSSLMADDDPYELLDEGRPTGVVELPVEWIRDDAVYFNMDRMGGLRPYTSPEAVLDIFRRELDMAHAEGGLYVLTMHPHHIGHRSRIFILDEIIRHAKSLPGVWFATHEEIARYCADQVGLQQPG